MRISDAFDADEVALVFTKEEAEHLVKLMASSFDRGNRALPPDAIEMDVMHEALTLGMAAGMLLSASKGDFSHPDAGSIVMHSFEGDDTRSYFEGLLDMLPQQADTIEVRWS